jgi:hypothetical protein
MAIQFPANLNFPRFFVQFYCTCIHHCIHIKSNFLKGSAKNSKVHDELQYFSDFWKIFDGKPLNFCKTLWTFEVLAELLKY